MVVQLCSHKSYTRDAAQCGKERIWNVLLLRVAMLHDGYHCIFCSRNQRRKSMCVQPSISSNLSQISLERMDELFGTANFSGIEDVGLATIHAKEAMHAQHDDEVPNTERKDV